MKLDFTSVWQYWPFLYHGALLTLKITAICAVLGFLLGIVLALVKISKYKPLIWFGRFYTSIFRGTPLLVQLCIVHFGLPQLLGFTLTTTQSGILTFTLNSAAYVSEIFRGGIMGVDKGQYEASMSLGINKHQHKSYGQRYIRKKQRGVCNVSQLPGFQGIGKEIESPVTNPGKNNDTQCTFDCIKNQF